MVKIFLSSLYYSIIISVNHHSDIMKYVLSLARILDKEIEVCGY